MIDLSQNDLSKIIYQLSESLALNKTLKDIYLVESRIDSAGVQALFVSLKENKHLQILKLDGNTSR